MILELVLFLSLWGTNQAFGYSDLFIQDRDTYAKLTKLIQETEHKVDQHKKSHNRENLRFSQNLNRAKTIREFQEDLAKRKEELQEFLEKDSSYSDILAELKKRDTPRTPTVSFMLNERDHPESQVQVDVITSSVEALERIEKRGIHLDQINTICRDDIRESFILYKFNNLNGNHGLLLAVDHVSGDPLGFLIAKYSSAELDQKTFHLAKIHLICSDSSIQGLGKQLLQIVERGVDSRPPSDVIFLESVSGAVRYYKSLGFFNYTKIKSKRTRLAKVLTQGINKAQSYLDRFVGTAIEDLSRSEISFHRLRSIFHLATQLLANHSSPTLALETTYIFEKNFSEIKPDASLEQIEDLSTFLRWIIPQCSPDSGLDKTISDLVKVTVQLSSPGLEVLKKELFQKCIDEVIESAMKDHSFYVSIYDAFLKHDPNPAPVQQLFHNKYMMNLEKAVTPADLKKYHATLISIPDLNVWPDAVIALRSAFDRALTKADETLKDQESQYLLELLSLDFTKTWVKQNTSILKMPLTEEALHHLCQSAFIKASPSLMKIAKVSDQGTRITMLELLQLKLSQRKRPVDSLGELTPGKSPKTDPRDSIKK